MLPYMYVKLFWTFFCLVSFCHGTNVQNWFSTVSDPKYECPRLKGDISVSDLIVEAISCEEPNAIFIYDYKIAGGKKPKRGPFNGAASLTFGNYGSNENLNYGLKNKKCLKLSMGQVDKITGTFVEDKLEGIVVIKFNSKEYLKGFAQDGKFLGEMRIFDEDNNLKKIINPSGDKILSVNFNETLILACQPHQFGDKCLLTQDFESYSECYNVDGDFFAHCYETKSLSNYIFEGCKATRIDKSDCDTQEQAKFNMMLSISTRSYLSQQKESFGCENSKAKEMRSELSQWIKAAEDKMLLWHQFNTEFDPLDLKNPRLDITLQDYQGRFGFESKPVGIYSTGGKLLFNGTMANGKIEANIDPSLASHPGWRTRLSICLDTEKIFANQEYVNLKKTTQYSKSSDFQFLEQTQVCSHLVQGMLKNGRLHGLVQIFGVTSIEKMNSCSDKVRKGLSYVGRYEDGIPDGPSWKGLTGGAWLQGNVIAPGEFTGDGISYIYPDLELAMVGQFNSGKMVSGQSAEISTYVCNPDGIPVLEFREPQGPTYRYERPTDITFGDQPHLQDPLDEKYVYLQKSSQFPEADANEGAFATKDIPKGTVYALYGGLLLSKEEQKAETEKLHKSTNDPLTIERAHMYTHTNKMCDIAIVIPPEFESTADYQGTIGHKVNHKFDPNSAYMELETPRFGVINALVAKKEIRKDEEYFASYGYSPETAPRWYIDLYIQFAKENPHLADPKMLEKCIQIKDARNQK